MKVGVIFFSFDLLNIDHTMILKDSKKQCEYLIVGLQLGVTTNDSLKNKSSKSIIEKYIQLKESKYVNEIIPYVTDQDIEDILMSFKIDVHIIEKKYKSIDFTGKKYCKKKGIEIFYSSVEYYFPSNNN